MPEVTLGTQPHLQMARGEGPGQETKSHDSKIREETPPKTKMLGTRLRS